jgi:hypothetical protein
MGALVKMHTRLDGSRMVSGMRVPLPTRAVDQELKVVELSSPGAHAEPNGDPIRSAQKRLAPRWMSPSPPR